MDILKDVSADFFGEHPLIEIDATLEPIRPYLPCGVISEGLIKTYPIEKVVNTMSRIFGLKLTDKIGIWNICAKIRGGGKVNANGFIFINQLASEVITFVVGNGEYNKMAIDQYMNKYGYFLSNERNLSDEWIRYQYEKKFDADVTDLVLEKQYIYHICPSSLEHKIFSQGLTPHESKYPSFDNDYRLYFFINPMTYDEFKSIVKMFKNEKNLNGGWLLLKIDLNNLNNIKFYLDPRMHNAVYSLEGIPPKAIEIIEKIL